MTNIEIYRMMLIVWGATFIVLNVWGACRQRRTHRTDAEKERIDRVMGR
jgi:hypothetical protein